MATRNRSSRARSARRAARWDSHKPTNTTYTITRKAPQMTSDQLFADRAGFWRRYSAFLIDSITISVLFQLIVAFLFIATSGHIQSETRMAEIGTSGSIQM